MSGLLTAPNPGSVQRLAPQEWSTRSSTHTSSSKGAAFKIPRRDGVAFQHFGTECKSVRFRTLEGSIRATAREVSKRKNPGIRYRIVQRRQNEWRRDYRA